MCANGPVNIEHRCDTKHTRDIHLQSLRRRPATGDCFLFSPIFSPTSCFLSIFPSARESHFLAHLRQRFCALPLPPRTVFAVDFAITDARAPSSSQSPSLLMLRGGYEFSFFHRRAYSASFFTFSSHLFQAFFVFFSFLAFFPLVSLSCYCLYVNTWNVSFVLIHSPAPERC